jgi:hypothetical protein
MINCSDHTKGGVTPTLTKLTDQSRQTLPPFGSGRRQLPGNARVRVQDQRENYAQQLDCGLRTIPVTPRDPKGSARDELAGFWCA